MRYLLIFTSRIGDGDITTHARQLKLDLKIFGSCLADGKHRTAIQQDILEAAQLGINGTPGFIIGRSTPMGVDGEILMGAHPLGRLRGETEGIRALTLSRAASA